MDQEALQEGLGDSGTVIDLTGCSLENVLYEVSAQRAVIVKTGAESSRVIVGYDEYNTYLLNPATGEVAPYGMNDSTTLFQPKRQRFYHLSGSCFLLSAKKRLIINQTSISYQGRTQHGEKTVGEIWRSIRSRRRDPGILCSRAVNLIGEHTDYNGGHVFSLRADAGTYGLARRREDRKLRFYSVNFSRLGVIETSLDDLVPSDGAGWTNYPKGVMWAFEKRGYTFENGVDFLIYGNIPTVPAFLPPRPWRFLRA